MQNFDYRALKKGFNKTAKTYEANAMLAKSTGEALIERLQSIKIAPQRILDIGSGTGALNKKLRKLYPKAKIFNIDLAEQRLRQTKVLRFGLNAPMLVCADAHALPFSDKSFDLIISNLCWHWVDHLGQAIYEAKRVLNVGGTLLFSTLGPDTLRELGAAFYSASSNPHIIPFFDMHDVGDALLKAGFADPVMDAEPMLLHFKKPEKLFKMLRDTGEGNYLSLRHRGLSGKKMFAQVKKYYENFKLDKTYPATFEIVFGYAWRPEDSSRLDQNNEISIPMSKIKRRK
jgi:malonyl-CoA O-methyltransferase